MDVQLPAILILKNQMGSEFGSAGRILTWMSADMLQLA
jgi:hypothetical protein